MTESYRHIPFTPTPEQRDNLLILADVLASPDRRQALAPGVRFNMSDYGTGTYGCGTIACAAGWGPAAGIRPTEDELDFDGSVMRWNDYIERAFGCCPWAGGNNRAAFAFLFSGGWASSDNTPEGAARRIRYALTKGIPLRDPYYYFIPFDPEVYA